MKLFIIGNGFDLHHSLPTRYTDFMRFMKERHPYAAEQFVLGIGKYSLLYFDRMDEVVRIFCGMTWKMFSAPMS